MEENKKTLLLILDGLTATGKTTTAKYLSDTFGFRIIKFPPEEIIKKRIKEMKSSNFEECKIYIDDLMDYLVKEVKKGKEEENIIIFDRSYISTFTFQAKTKEIEEYILNRYIECFKMLNIDLENSLTLFFNKRIDGVEREQKIGEKYLLEEEYNIEGRFNHYATYYIKRTELKTDLVCMDMNKTKIENLKDFIILYFRLDYYDKRLDISK